MMKTTTGFLLFSSCIAAAAAAQAPKAGAPAAAPTYLDCTGISPFWTGSWATPVIGMDNDGARLTIKLAPDGSAATVRFLHTGEQVFKLSTDGEYYQGSKRLDIPSLDGRIGDIFLSINRINGETSAGFTVTGSPNDARKLAFAGTCRKASAQF